MKAKINDEYVLKMLREVKSISDQDNFKSTYLLFLLQIQTMQRL
jgi:hypothetical protein